MVCVLLSWQAEVSFQEISPKAPLDCGVISDLEQKKHLQQQHCCLSSSDFWQWLAVALLNLIVSGLKVSWHQHKQNEELPKRSHQLIPWELAVPALLSVVFRTERIYR